MHDLSTTSELLSPIVVVSKVFLMFAGNRSSKELFSSTFVVLPAVLGGNEISFAFRYCSTLP